MQIRKRAEEAASLAVALLLHEQLLQDARATRASEQLALVLQEEEEHNERLV